MGGTTRRGLTLVHFSTQPEPFSSLKHTETTKRVPPKVSRQAEQWTSVSPCLAQHATGALLQHPPQRAGIKRRKLNLKATVESKL